MQGGRSALFAALTEGVTGEEDEEDEEAALAAVLLEEREPKRENWGAEGGEGKQTQKRFHYFPL